MPVLILCLVFCGRIDKIVYGVIAALVLLSILAKGKGFVFWVKIDKCMVKGTLETSLKRPVPLKTPVASVI